MKASSALIAQRLLARTVTMVAVSARTISALAIVGVEDIVEGAMNLYVTTVPSSWISALTPPNALEFCALAAVGMSPLGVVTSAATPLARPANQFA